MSILKRIEGRFILHLVVVVSLLLGTFISEASGQEERKVIVSLGGGVSIPSQPSEFADYWNLGFNVGAGLGYSLSPSFSLTGYFDYNHFSFNADRLLEDMGATGQGISIVGGSISFFTVLGILKASLIPSTDSPSPYFLGGVGLMSLSSSDVTISGGGMRITQKGNSDSEFSILFGAGLDIPAGETVGLFVQAAYGIGFSKGENTNYLPVKAGLTFRL